MSGAGFEPAINWTQTNHVAKLHYPLVTTHFIQVAVKHLLKLNT